jgi:predicted DCC family thiol-disulfide oxidoreductase YuxK
MGESNIVFFDGVCGLCNRTVDFLLREDRQPIFLYSPLQGETFQRIMLEYPETLNSDSIFVLKSEHGKNRLLKRSEAFLYILDKLPRYRWLARIGYLVPAPILDAFYRLIATTRYQLWGKRDLCRLPNAEERTRFLP